MSTNAQESGKPSPAELFERFFGRSLFIPWSRVLLEEAKPQAGERVLDLACATGIVARQVAPIVGGSGRVMGLDLSPEMLKVARAASEAEGAGIEWLERDAADLGLPDGSFDLVLCQQGIQFFPDPLAALREVKRVLRDGGRLALNVWQPLGRHPVYSALLEAEARHVGTEVEEVAAPFMFGDRTRLESLLEESGFRDIAVTERTLEVEFEDPDRFVALTIMAAAAVLPELANLDDDEREALIQAVSSDAEGTLRAHIDGDRLRFPTPNYIATATT